MREKICVFDIDGVLNYYPQTWVRFVNEKEKADYKSLDEIKDSLSYSKYKKLKESYRVSGVKAEFAPRKGVINLINKLRDLGYLIIIISARPVSKYPSLYKQTVDWLDSRGIQYDNLLFSDKKQFEVIKYYPNMEFMVEDNRLIANIMSGLGYKVFLVDNEYNQGEIKENVKRIKSFEEVLKDASK